MNPSITNGFSRIEILARHCCCIVLLFSASLLHAQDHFLPPSDSRLQEAIRVYDRIVRAIQMPGAPPRLLLYDGKKYAAQAFADHRIVLDSRLFELTRELGADSNHALAYILGHELHHAISEDFWCHNISASRALVDTRTLEIIRRQDATRNIEQRVIAESRADAIGTMYAYLAGYGGEIPVEAVLRAVYLEYQPSTDGYPPFDERLALIRTTHDRIHELLPLFDAANRWMVMGAYDAAAVAYSRLLQDFPAREVFNNLGVSRALHALSTLPAPPPVAFPFQLDCSLRAEKNLRRGDAEEDPVRLLMEARDSFEQAMRRDTGYVTAQMNLAAVEALLAENGDHHLALGIASRACKRAEHNGTPRTLATALGVLGSIHMLHGDQRIGRELLEKAEKISPDLPFIRGNLHPTGLNDPTVPGCEKSTVRVTVKEQIDGSETDMAPRVTPRTLLEGERLAWGVVIENHIRSILYRDFGTAPRQIVILTTTPSCPASSVGGIRLGSSAADVVSVYGCPTAVLAIPDGMVYRYDGNAIAFFMNDTNHVTEWMIW